MISIPIWLVILLLPSLCLGSLFLFGWILIFIGKMLQILERYSIRRGWTSDGYPCEDD